jgi:hypothetical protein
MPGRQACELCPQLTFVSGHFKEYQRLGDAAIKVIGDLTPLPFARRIKPAQDHLRNVMLLTP